MGARGPFEEVAREDVRRFGPGDDASQYRPGDFILTHGEGWISRMIRFGQGFRIRGEDRKYTHWSHAALIVSETGDLIEALGRGVCRTHISRYSPKEYGLVHIQASAEDRQHAVRFAQWAADQRYGFLTIVSIIYATFAGGRVTFAIEGQTICSGLVARAMERTGAIFNRTPSHIMPADLAKYYRVEPPRPGGDQGPTGGGGTVEKEPDGEATSRQLISSGG